jgi:hypothetical protein
MNLEDEKNFHELRLLLMRPRGPVRPEYFGYALNIVLTEPVKNER